MGKVVLMRFQSKNLLVGQLKTEVLAEVDDDV